jgi:hypothetical protein
MSDPKGEPQPAARRAEGRHAPPDPDADYWTVADVAAYLGIKPETVRTYRSRNRGELPPEDKMFGRSPVWKPATITAFARLGQGHRTDLE